MMIKLYWNKPHLVLLLLGFTSGLPFLLILSTLSIWLTEAGVSKTMIGAFMCVSLPYSLKFLWAPLLDHITLPGLGKWLGQRRSWAFFAQLCVIASLVGMAHCDPNVSLSRLAIFSTLVAFCSATLDSVIDAYRIDLLAEHQIGSGAAIEIVGFKLGMAASGAGALYLAQGFTWSFAYLSMAALCLLGIVAILYSNEPQLTQKKLPRFTGRKTFSVSGTLLLQLLCFIFFFKLVDIALNSMLGPFLYELGFSKIDFANFSKVYGTLLMIAGGLLGGMAIHRFGILFVVKCAIALQIFSALVFITQAQLGHHYLCLTLSLGIENLSSGLAATAFIAFLSQFCRQGHGANDFTLLYSFGSLSRVLISALAGYLSDHLSWQALFMLSACLGFFAFWFLFQITRSAEIFETQADFRVTEPRKTVFFASE